MFGFSGGLRRKLRKERRRHQADLAKANQEIDQLRQAVQRAENTIEVLEGKVPDVYLPSQLTGQIIYACEDLKLARTDLRLAQFHTVGKEEFGINLVDRPHVTGNIEVYLQENGYGDRRLILMGSGDACKTDSPKENYWRLIKNTTNSPIRDWLMRVPGHKIQTRLPKNADPEDRSWEALGADIGEQ